MSEEAIDVSVPAARHDPAKIIRDLLRALAKPVRSRRLHVGALNQRDLADLGLSRDPRREDPRPASHFGPHSF